MYIYNITPQKYLVELTEEQHKRLARVLFNTSPNTMDQNVCNR